MPESQNIEWKRKWKDDYLEWICGYANAQGGKIYIGCDDVGNIVGLPNAHKLLEDIPNKLREAMGIIVDVNLCERDGKEYIEIDVPAGYTMPQLSEKLGISRKTVAQRLKQLKEKGVIERIGSDRKGYWKIKGSLNSVLLSP